MLLNDFVAHRYPLATKLKKHLNLYCKLQSRKKQVVLNNSSKDIYVNINFLNSN